MEIRTQHIRRALQKLQESSALLEEKLNSADSKLGDGDTGAMLSRFIGSLNNCLIEDNADLSKTFMTLAQAGSASTGSSFGTLLMTGLMSFAKGTKDKNHIDHKELGALMIEARNVMLQRGRSNLGDKTAIDAIDAIASCLTETSDEDARSKLFLTLEVLMEEFKTKPCQIGRARMFAEKSIGLDDPGMLAIRRITEIIIGK